jgi:hypothetical protein
MGWLEKMETNVQVEEGEGGGRLRAFFSRVVAQPRVVPCDRQGDVVDDELRDVTLARAQRLRVSAAESRASRLAPSLQGTPTFDVRRAPS